ncbi:MarC family NAAT transporter [Lewinella sp. JB7]|uniref:MarC family NAAT transporter n=1 Tax=Lewinella sp. JB7 TaxID=2962887 RepID=UPI0020C9417F|nr:MarC family NAAT transporter [Lewinella sp. JB7]MCP9235538.1 MarC family NAAT transporter [Lewinella sp. JB7]
MISFFFATLGSLFSVVNPLGAVPMYLTLTNDYSKQERSATALRTAIYFMMILVVFFFAGSVILNFFGISLNALRIAGGLIIVNSGYGLLNSKFERRRISHQIEEEAQQKEDISFTPMAMPMLSGPGSISLLIGLSAVDPSWRSSLLIVGVVVVMALLIFVTLKFAPLLFRLLGRAGLSALSRIMGFLVMAIGIQMLIYGLVSLIGDIWPQVELMRK